MNIHGVMVVWGEAYTAMFLTHFLPSHLSEGNLPALAQNHTLRFKLYTTPDMVPQMEASPAFRRLRQIMPVDLIDLSEQETWGSKASLSWGVAKFRTLAACHRHAMDAAWAEDAGLMFYGPDTLISDGAFNRLNATIASGRRGLLVIHQSARIATFQPDLERLFPADAHGVRAIPPRDLSALALAHRHPWTESLFMGGDTFNISSHLYWRLPGGAYLAHGWHLCIPFLHPQRLPASPFWSIDNDYTNQVIDDPGTLEVVEDSDHITFVEVLVEQAPRYWRPQECSFTPLRYALGMEGLFQSEHSRLLVRHGVAQHGGPPEAHWADVRKEARDTVDDILHWDAFLRGASSASLSPRQQRAASHEIDRLHDQISTLENRLAQGGAEGHPRQLTYLWANLGKLHCSLAQTAEAARAMARVLEVCGTNAHAALRIARAAGQWGYPDLRRRAVRRVSELDPSLLEQSGIELA